MMELTPDYVVQTIRGEWVDKPDHTIVHNPIREISIDSRTISSGDLFWALEGLRFDGHNFVMEALKKGALAAVISKPIEVSSFKGRLIKIDDSISGLQMLAAAWRRKQSCPIVAVTGSSGKTTTKELIARILSQKYICLSTKGNMNNHIGVPLTLLRLREKHDVAVVELGMNHQGEIAQLTKIAKPTIGVITNIGKAHIGLLGSINCIIEAKAELLEGMDPESLAILNRDDPYFYILAKKCQNGIITVGESEKADIKIQKIALFPEEGRTEIAIKANGETFSLSLPVLGRFIAYNIGQAIAVTMKLGCSRNEVKSGIARFDPIPNRMDHHIVNGIHILDDSYNANPESMHSALSTLFECKCSARSMAILGDMLELGNQSECLHRQLGQWIGHNKKVDFLITYGPQAKVMAQEAIKMGYPSQKVWSMEQGEDVSKLANSLLDSGDWVLIKGSRNMGLDRVSKKLMELLDLKNDLSKKGLDKEEPHQCSTI